MSFLKTICYLFCFVLLFTATTPGQDYEGTLTFSPDDLSIESMDGFDFVHLNGGIPHGLPGSPALPSVQRNVAIPWDMEVFKVKILSLETVELDGTYNVSPMTPPQKLQDIPMVEAPFSQNTKSYEKEIPLPGLHVENLGGWDLVGQKFVKLAFYPVQYTPSTGKISLATEIRFALYYNTLPEPSRSTHNLTPSGKDSYRSFMERNTLNPEAIDIPAFNGSSSPVLPAGQYEHVIITPPAFSQAWDSLVTWHTRKGYPDTVVTTDFIYDNYQGDDPQTKIRAFVRDAHSVWGARFFILGADGGDAAHEIPFHQRFYTLQEETYDVPNDTYYADYNNDWIVDVHIGRVSVTDTDQIAQFISKVLHYEQTPTLNDYGNRVFFMGFDLDGGTRGEGSNILIQTNELPSHIQLDTEYDSEGGTHLDDVIEYLNSGPNLVNHTGHGNEYVWGMGYTNHNQVLTQADVEALTNGWKLINWYTLGCWANAWDTDTSISETFMRKVGGAGVSFTGNTRYGWYAPGYVDVYSSLYDLRWWHVLFADNQYHVGETLSAHKNDHYPSDYFYQYIFDELHLLGDPAMPLWMDNPAEMTVFYTDPIITGEQGFTVTVEKGGNDLEDALVCLWKDSEIYQFVRTDAQGEAVFFIDPLTEGTLLLTVTAQNCLPHEADVAIIEDGPPEVLEVHPTHGSVDGGTAVTLIGSRFVAGQTDLFFGGKKATNVEVIDTTTLTCITPPHRAELVDVEVSTNQGSGSASSAFGYNAAPTLSSISPTDGPIAGGTSCTLTGTDFTTSVDTTITFGGTSATSVVVVNATTATCTAPAKSAGAVDVVMTNSEGSATLTNGYTYHSAPTLTSASPNNGAEGGGTSVTLTGTNFTTVGTTSVTFGGTAATAVTVVNSTTITCTTPSHTAGQVDVVVTNDFGNNTLTNGYTFNNAPTVSAISPTDGPIAGSTSCTITGTYFTTTPDTSVTIGGTAATSVTVLNATTITCTSPAGTAGSANVVVTNSNGTATLTNGFTYHNAPSLTSVSPNNGPIAGGTSVTLTGTDFTSVGTTTVTFGGTAATSVSVVNATSITCTAPAHAAGQVNVVVTNDFGNDTLTNGYTYNNPPTVTSISPTDGPVAGGTACTITGTYFTTTPDTTVTIGGTAATSVVVVNATTVTCTAPAHTVGAVDVVVTNSNGSDTLTSGYTYHNAPSLTSVSPNSGPVAGSTAVTLTGADFSSVGTTTVTFGGTSATAVTVVNTTTITCTTPAHAAGVVDVVVTNDFGTDTLTSGYTYNNPPTLSSISPTDGPIAGGTACTLTGTNFTTSVDTTVTFGGTSATSVVVVNATTVTCTAPAHAAGAVDVVLTNSNGTDTLTSGYTYHNAPTLTSVSPDNGPETGGTAVTLTGTDFTSVGTTTVTFDGTSATAVTVVNATTITCTAPAHTPGAVDLVVTDDFGSDTLTSGYTYNNPPTLSSISPTDGSTAGGTACTLTGTYFTTSVDTTVTFGGTAATSVVVVNATTVTCTAPAHAAGAVDVVLTNSNGSDTLTGGFAYHNAPSLTSVSPNNGPETGGTAITLTGTDFTTTGTTTVTFDGTSATGVTVVNATTITCTNPAHTPGAVDVAVTNDFGSDTLTSGYTYNNPPTVTGISPTDGPIAGGTACTITGTYFTTSVDTTVTFGGTAATSVVVVNATTVTCTAPAHAAGAVDVVLTNSNGTDTLTSGYTYHNAPTLTSASPDNGPETGGTAVTLTGTDFTSVGTTTVTFDGTSATAVTVVNATTITCTAPAHTPGAVDLVVTDDFGSDTLTSGYTYNNPPTLSSISPTDGSTAGGTACTLTGTYFTTSVDTTVTFGGTAATSVVVVNATTVTCTAPAHATGAVDVVLTNSNGSDTLIAGFAYHNAPTLTSVSPSSGPETGGTSVTLTGTDFTTSGTTTVTFDGTSATSIFVVNATTITCATPAHAAGLVDVVVTNDFGSDTLTSGYTYNNPPTITGISPTDGVAAGGTACTITGTYFTTTPDTTVTFDGTSATSVVVVNATTVTCNAPAHAAGSVNVVLSNSNGSDTLTNGYTYHNAPTLTSVSPNNGPETGGTAVTLTGTAFTTAGTTTVTFDGTNATGITVVNATTITCTTPAHAAGSVDVIVTNDFGSDTLTSGYTYNNPPTVTGISPTDGPIAGGTACTITGTYFTTSVDTTVTFGGTAATSVVVVNATTVTCNAPAHAAGSVDVVLTNSNGSDTLTSGYTYHNAPALTSVSPNNGTPSGGTSVTLTGTDFTTVGTTTVTFGGTSATAVTVVNATTITCTTPAHTAGAVDLVVTNNFGTDTLTGGYTYNNAPAITSISPTDGPIAGGTSCTITGTGFTTSVDTTVTFGGTSATSVVVVNATTATCTAPAHTAGAVDVVMTNSNGTDTLTSGFTYHSAPTLTSASPNNGPVAGGTAVTLTGTDFTTVGTTTVTFGGTSATAVTVVNATTLTCTTPAHAAGAVDVVVTNNFGTDTLSSGYTYDNPPSLSSISPTDGPIAGGTACTITGTYFTTSVDTSVTFGGTSATSVVVVNATTVTCTAPAHAAGSVDVVMTNSNGSDTLTAGYTYHNAPTLTSVSPNNGTPSGGTSVTLTGADFTSAGTTTVTFGGTSATAVTVVNATTITCTTPAHAAGAVDLVVTNNFGTDTLTSGYTYNNAPAITSISPTDGPIAGGTSCTLTGTGFTTSVDTTVTFGGTSATSVVVVNATTATCTAPAHTAGAVDVVLTNSNGSDTLANGYTYHNAPGLTSISPNNGSPAGATSVTLTGTDFTTAGTTTVTFGGTSATAVTVVNATTITCTTPAHAAGAVDLVVTNDFGTDTLTSGYTYNNAPTVSAISPTDGPVAGGTSCTITGTYFTTSVDTTVTFGGTAATAVIVVNATTITCTAPAHTAGAVDLVMTNSNGSGTLTSGYTYHNAPTLTSASPNNGTPSGGTSVTLTGTDFTTVGTTTVTFGGTSATAVTVVNATTITCTTPAHAAGAVDLVVTNNFGSDTLTSGYTYNNAPAITSISPTDGPIAGGTSCTITGTGFTTSVDTTVTFGGTSATSVVVVNATTATCTAPAHTAGAVDVVLTNSNGSDTLTSGFTYHNAPSLTSVSPNNGTPAGGTAVTLTGTDFTTVGTSTVTFGGTSATAVTVVNATTITCTTPAHAAGAVDVVVTNDFGTDTLTSGYTYNNAPTVSAISPTDGPVAGGTACTITGTYFTTSVDTTVTFGGTAATAVTVVSATSITCTSPAHTAGAVDVVVTNSNGSATLTSGYTYHNAPTLTGVSPNNGTPAGSTSVTLTGTDFTTVGTTTVTFGGTSATAVTVVNATTITCTTPAHAAGAVDVVVTNNFGSDTLTSGYTYNNAPSLTSVSPTDGPIAGGTSCTITGTGFTTSVDTTVTFGGTSATSVVVVNATTATCTAPAHTAGAVDVVLTNSNGSDTLTSAFTYHNAPSLTSVSPNNGPTTGSTSVTLTGTDFTTVGTTTVTFGGTSATAVTVVNATTITCTTPAHAAGAVNVVVTNNFGTNTLTSGYTFNTPSTLSGISPTDGPIAGGTACTLTGTNFTTTPDTTITFGGTSATSVVVVNSTTATCTAPAHAAGAVNVVMINSNGTYTLPSAYTYHNAPTLTSVSPNSGSPAGGEAVTLTGTDFTTVGTTTVTFGGTSATAVTVVNATTITCTTPAHAAGAVNVVITNNFGTNTLTSGYTYNSPPTVSSISPTDGPVGGSTACTITGTGFTTTPDTTVTFDGTAATSVVVVSATSITCSSPAHAAGAVDVVVTNSNGSATLSSGFTYHNAPTLSSVSPNNGPIAGATAVTLTGTNFSALGTTTVTFGGTSATAVTVVNATTITCTTPAHAAGVVNVVITNDFGSDTLTSGYTYNNAPTVSAISPTDGPIAGGTACTITGTGFTTSVDTTVTFGGTSATAVTVVNATTITCTSPAHTAGAVDVVVTNSNGTDTLTSGFTYHNAPDLTSVSPNNGSPAGGAAVTLTGTDFTSVGTTTVTFGGTSATAVTVVNATTITCTTPAHAAGAVDVVVTNDYGNDTLTSGYTYNNAPTVTAISPTDGPVAGSTACTITGTGFTTTPDTTVTIGGTAATSVVVVSATSITCTTPAHAAGAVDVVVTNSNGSGTLTSGFTYHNAPALSSVSPNNGPIAGGTAVTLTGTDFSSLGTTTVTFGGTSATSVTVVSATSITCTTPAHAAGVVDVVVTNGFGSDTLTSGYTYNSGPVISSISPENGPIAGGTLCTITGTGFTTSVDTTVTFGGTSATSITVLNSTTLTCNTPAHSAGSVDVVITNSNGSGTATNGYTYHNAPSLSSISPNNGSPSGGTAVTLTGTDFTTVGTTSVTFGGTAATSITIVNTTTITCTSPAHAAGAVDVVLTNDFGSDTLTSGYTYNNAPTVTAISPTDGPIAGGTACTITGTAFTTSVDTTVTIGGTAATSVVVVNATTITCTTPAHAAGAVDVTVSNSNGSGTLTSGYTYHNAPDLTSVSPNNGSPAGGTAVNLTGTDFTTVGTTTVTFDGTAATNVTVVNATSITCTSPAHTPATVNVVVTNDFGSDTLTSGYTYNNPPTVSSISPTDGAVTGGTSCTVTGTDFTTSPDTSVTFGGTAASNVVVLSATSLTCDSPPHTAGTVDVAVTNSNGTDTLSSAFTFHNPPSLVSVSPNNGPPSGGTAVTLTGTNYTGMGTTTVTFGGTAATGVTVVNATTITCTAPTHAAGVVDVVVTNDFGNDTLTSGYTYNNPPTVTGINPANGPIAGGTTCTINGTYFTTTPDTTVTFGGTAATGVNVVNATTISCTAPAHAAGAADVVVTNSNGTGTLTSGFTYHNAPNLTGASPNSGSELGGTAVTLIGTDFTSVGTTSVTFGGSAATSVTVVNATTITCNTPAHTPGVVNVVVTNDYGSDTLTNGFTFNNVPVISGISPTNGPVAGGTACTITGNYFTTSGDTTVTFGGSAATSVAVVNTTTITCNTPAHSAGPVNVVITNSNGSDTLTSGFTYHNPPSLTAISPNNGPQSGGTACILFGTDFSTLGTTSVSFGGTAGTSVIVVNSTTITCTAPAHAPGAVDVSVINDFGTDTLTGGYTYNNAPVISSVNPQNGPVAGGIFATLSGTGFTTSGDTSLTFGGTAATNIVVLNSTTLSCTVPAHTAGAVDLVITNSNGSDTLTSGFTYHNVPTLANVSPDNGPEFGGTAVTLTGTDFTSVGTTSVIFDATPATNVTVVNTTTITCTSPAHTPGSVNVIVSNDFGSDTLIGGFSYNEPPVVSSISPTDGPVVGGTACTLSGSYFTTSPDTTVYFGITSAGSVVVVDANTITCTAPAHLAGTVDISVYNSNGSDTLSSGYTYHNVPVLTSVSPDNGPEVGGTAVTLTGTDFTTVGATSVTFDGTAATSVVVVNSTTITCSTPAHAPGMVDVVVTNNFGSDTLGNSYAYNEPPVISGISPTDGTVAGGDSCTITGNYFTTSPDTTVTFNATAATNVVVVNATTLTCDTPAHSAGTVGITVSNSNGSDTLASAYTFHNPPAITAVSPDNGPEFGGTFVTLTGTDFSGLGTTTVTFDGLAATGLIVVNTTTITCTTPAHTPGIVDVAVTNDFGSDTLASSFTYNEPPVITAINPTDGSIAGGDSCTLTGNYFTTSPDTTVTFGALAATNVTVVNATTLTCDSPAQAAGTVDITVSNSNGTDTLTSGFTYHNAPTLTGISPTNGSELGSTVVTLTGTDFTPVGTTTVTFGGTAASGVTVVNSTTITCSTPVHTPGIVDLVLTNDFGTDTLASSYTFNDVPVISSITPENGPVAGGTPCTVTGFYFTTSVDTTVTFGASPATNVVVVNPTTLTCDAPAHTAGTLDVTVGNSNGSDTLLSGYTYHNVPSLTGIAPNNGTESGGTVVTLSGADFTSVGTTTVTFDGLAATSVTVVSTTAITCITPAHGPGLVDVVLTNDFGSDTMANGFNYNNPPTLAGVSPVNGPIAGGTSCLITGTYFTTSGDTTITFGGTPATNVVVLNATTMTCLTPAHAAGTVDIVVTNSNGTDTLSSAFTYHNPPDLLSMNPDNGSEFGGTIVTLTGNYFSTIGTTQVTFGGSSALGINVVNGATIICTTPAHAAGSVDVVVTNDFGSDTLTNGYTYNAPPSVLNISPQHGSVSGGLSCTILGGGFTTSVDTTVAFGSTPATNVVIINANTLTCTSPAHVSGVVDISVSNSNGSDTLSSAFTYHNPPDITSITPNQGYEAGGLPVTLTGTSFTAGGGGMQVSFGSTAATNVTVVNTTTITCITPPHSPGSVNVTVSNDFGSDILVNGFLYNVDPPSVSSITPDYDSIAGGAFCTIAGGGFTTTVDTTVTFGGTSASNLTVVNATTITCDAPAHSVGSVDVVVINSNGSGTLTAGFTYHDAPTLSSINPSSGMTAGGNSVTLSGTGFTGVATNTVTFGGDPATSVVVVNATTMTCVTPAHAAGVVDVTLTNDFGSDTLTNAFTYSSQPTIYHVPGDIATIQGAIDAANANTGDIVLVSPGTYMENLNFLGKAITVRSDMDGNDNTHDPSAFNTIINGGQNGSVVVFNSGEGGNSILEGFTLSNGSGTIKGAGTNGGAIYCINSSPKIQSNVIKWNSAQINGGGIACFFSSAKIINNFIHDNTCFSGGGISSRGCFLSIINNTLVGNSANSTGGALYMDSGSSIVVANTIMALNNAPTGLEIYIGTAANPSTLDIDYSDVLGGLGAVEYATGNEPTWGANMISAMPLFVDSGSRNYHLTKDSPCLDAGNNNAPFIPTFDIDADPRVAGGHGGIHRLGQPKIPRIVDIGADEVYATKKQLHSGQSMF